MASIPVRPCLRRVSRALAESNPRDTHAHLTNPLRRWTGSTLPRASSSSPFSTSTRLAAAAAASSTRRTGSTLKISRKSNAPTSGGKPPGRGERKAFRKKIVLSNANALEVDGLGELSPRAVADPAAHCRVLALPGAVVDQLRLLGAFKPTQGWKYFRRPATLMRAESLRLASVVDGMAEGKEPFRAIVSGERGTGKSALLTQAMAMALLKNWVVISIPDPKDLILGHTDYAPLPDTEPQLYFQKAYTARLLYNTARANRDVLREHTVSQAHPGLPSSVSPDMTLDRFAQLGARDSDFAWPVFRALWAELTKPGLGRPPVMLALDGLASLAGPTEYLSADVKPIHALDLAQVRHFFEQLAGRSLGGPLAAEQRLPNGGAVLAALSQSERPPRTHTAAVELAVAQNEARAAAAEGPPARPYDRDIDHRVYDALREVRALKVGALSREEARALVEYYAKSGALMAPVSEAFLAEKLALAGGGVVGELERGTVRAGL
ncbi:mitochondrial ribosomal death-associated protein 3-domain-containing protein [Lineolata rhizophorae]|uniref:Small ribosomal subunit protein mS29 n=1 Tax=Lineolata rhizophorae TaxID=578093 RepID=A0A6A6NYC4_9PEZI|nr:mitochondrial ribosomal death-associated protein 3-domain-containing protein [Lineolata rhizophorae]